MECLHVNPVFLGMSDDIGPVNPNSSLGCLLEAKHDTLLHSWTSVLLCYYWCNSKDPVLWLDVTFLKEVKIEKIKHWWCMARREMEMCPVKPDASVLSSSPSLSPGAVIQLRTLNASTGIPLNTPWTFWFEKFVSFIFWGNHDLSGHCMLRIWGWTCE